MNVPLPKRRSDGPQDRPKHGAGFPEGLASAFYLGVRCEEECYRARRYGRPLTLLVVELVGQGGSSGAEERLQSLLRSQLRLSDTAGCLGEKRYAVLLPETDRDGAATVASRLVEALPHVRAGIAVHPQDGSTLEDLVSAAVQVSERDG